MSEDNRKPEVKGKGYPHTGGIAASSRRGRPATQLGQAERRLAAPDPDSPGIDITGRYEGSFGEFTIQVNQAGSHIECWLVDYKTKAFRIVAGELIGNRFTLHEPGKSDKIGFIVFDEVNGHSFTLDGESLGTLNKVGPGPTMSLDGISTLPLGVTRDRVRQEQHFPLTSKDRDRILRGVRAAVIVPLLKGFRQHGGGTSAADQLNRAQAAKKINRHIFDLFQSLHEDDHLLASDLAIQSLGAELYTEEDVTQPLLSWLQEMYSQIHSERSPPLEQLKSLNKHLRLAASTEFHDYKFLLEVLGPSGDFIVGASGFYGTLDIEKTTNGKTTKLGPRHLVLFMFSAGFATGVSAGFSTRGETFKVPFDWALANFDGPFGLVDASGRFYAGGHGETRMLLHGDGRFPSMSIDFTGWSWHIGVGGGVEAGGGGGYIFPTSAPPVKKGKHNFRHDYALSRGFDREIFFKFGSALLTPAAKRALRVMCAQELLAFSSKESLIIIASHADRVDSEERNKELTELRAKNTKQAIRDILGGALKTPDDRIEVLAFGESISTDEDGTKNPSQRKSDIVVNSRLVLTLFGRE